MALTLNDTLGVKRETEGTTTSAAVLGGDAAEEARDPVLQDREEVSALPAPGQHLHRPAPRHRMARGVGQGQGLSPTPSPIAARRAFQGAEPYAVASVTLDEGVNVIADMVNCTAEDLKVGMRVKPYWHPLDNGEHLLMWQPDKDAK